MIQNQDNYYHYTENKNKIRSILGVFVVILALFLITVFIYLNKKNAITKNNEKRIENGLESYRNMDKGVIGIPVIGDSNQVLEKRMVIAASSKGIIGEEEVNSSTDNTTIGKIYYVYFDAEDINNNPLTLKIVVQIESKGVNKNIIPQYLKNIYRMEGNNNYTDQIVGVNELKRIFIEGKRWLIIPLIKESMLSNYISGTEYYNFAQKYYTEDEWLQIENGFKGGFNKYFMKKPILIYSINFVQLPK